MPFTPFHLGPALLIGLLLFQFIHLPAFLIANIILDFEPFLILFLGLNYPLHGFFPSFLGSSVIAVILSLIMIKLDKKVQKVMHYLKLKQKHSKKSIWLAAFFGTYLHVILDSFIYTDIKPFFPLNFNLFYTNSIFTSLEVYSLCTISFVLGIALYAYILIKIKKARI